MHDTLGYVKRLEAVGIPRAQAEAQVQIMSEVIDTNLATKQDLKDLATELRTEMKDLKTELRVEMTDIRTDMARLEDRLTIKLGTMMVVSVSALAAIIKFF